MLNPKNISDNNALLLYRVGPVFCCSPTRSVESVVIPPSMSKPPGVNSLRPGVFKHVSGIVNIVDLRVAFGVDSEAQGHSGRIIIVNLESAHSGFWVDEIIDVIKFPDKGWGQLPALIPRDIFERILLFNEKIQLYCQFEKLNICKKSGYLREYIHQLETIEKKDEMTQGSNANRALKNNADVPEKEKKLTVRSSINDEAGNVKVKTDKISSSASPGSLNSSSKQQFKSAIHKIEPVEKETANNKTAGVNVGSITDRQNLDLNNEYKNKLWTDVEKKATSSRDETVKDQVATSNKQQQQILSQENNATYSRDYSSAHTNVKEKSISKDVDVSGRNAYGDDEDDTLLFVSIITAIAVLLAIVVFYVLDGGVQTNDDERLSGAAEVVEAVNDISIINQSAGQNLDAAADIEEYVENVDAAVDINNDVEDVLVPVPQKHSADNTDNLLAPEISQQIAEGTASVEKDEQGYVIVIEQFADNVIDEKELNTTELDTKQDIKQSTTNLGLKQHEADQAESEINEVFESKEQSVKQDFIVDQDLQENDMNDIDESQASEAVIVSDVTDSIEKQTDSKGVQGAEASKDKVVSKEIVHIVVKGDTLWHIARRYVANPYRYPELAKLSNIKNPDLIYPGDRVKIIIIYKK